jgi:uncharacterized protein YbjT (DUF2867 family)
MKILICGATGFVGRHLTTSLRAAGHTVIRGVRKPSQPNDIAVDYCKDTAKEAWLPKLAGIDTVINAVGVLRDSAKQPMKLLHEQSPIALFSACQEAGVKRIVQVSALGVDKGIETPYFQTRRAPEAYLNNTFNRIPPVVRRPSEVPVVQAHHERNGAETVRLESFDCAQESPVEGHSDNNKSDSVRFLILRPSVIYGEDGASAKMFRLQASLPVHTLPAGGGQKLQPVHIEDICAAVNRWLADPDAQSQTVSCVGLEATDMRGMLDSYRQQLHHSKALHISIPAFFVGLSARMGDYIPASPLCSDTLTMLNAGNTGDATEFTKLLGRPPRSYRTFVSSGTANAIP